MAEESQAKAVKARADVIQTMADVEKTHAETMAILADVDMSTAEKAVLLTEKFGNGGVQIPGDLPGDTHRPALVGDKEAILNARAAQARPDVAKAINEANNQIPGVQNYADGKNVAEPRQTPYRYKWEDGKYQGLTPEQATQLEDELLKADGFEPNTKIPFQLRNMEPAGSGLSSYANGKSTTQASSYQQLAEGSKQVEPAYSHVLEVTPGQFTVIPGTDDQGNLLNIMDVYNMYKQTGRSLGTFNNVEDAMKLANDLYIQQKVTLPSSPAQ
jgi:hypothetical protein